MRNKKIFALILAVMMISTTFMSTLTVMAGQDPADPPADPPASSGSMTDQYTVVKPEVTAAGLGAAIIEEVAVDKAGAMNPKLAYTLTLGEMKVYEADGVIYGDKSKVIGASAITGQLGTVDFDAGEVVGSGNKEKPYAISDSLVTAINALEFDRPGIYFWEISKAVNNDAYPNDNEPVGALLIRVDENNQKLHAPVVAMAAIDPATGMPTGDKNVKYEDVFPDAPGLLTVENNVSGNQGSKDQYMKYTVTLTGLQEYAGTSITPTGDNSVKSETNPKYGETFGSNYNNLEPKTIREDGTVTFEVWLKDDETIHFPNIPTPSGNSGVGFTVQEQGDTHTGYGVTNKVGDDTKDGDKATGTLDPDGTRVEFFNTKNTDTPTGVIMTVAPAFAVILIGSIGVGIILAGKRGREEDEEEA